jgi:hypothetical protein
MEGWLAVSILLAAWIIQGVVACFPRLARRRFFPAVGELRELTLKRDASIRELALQFRCLVLQVNEALALCAHIMLEVYFHFPTSSVRPVRGISGFLVAGTEPACEATDPWAARSKLRG